MTNEDENSCILNLDEYHQHFMTEGFEEGWRRNRIAVIRVSFFFIIAKTEKKGVQRKNLF